MGCFGEWGVPSAESIIQARQFKSKFKSKKKREEIVILRSGGIRSGIDMAKVIALGSDLVGVAMSFAKAGMESQKAVEDLIDRYAYELQTAMFGVGVKAVGELQDIKLTD